MPYKLKASDGGFYVESESGTKLSKKPLSETRAKKQLTAATLSSLRSEGKIPPRAADQKQLIGLMHGKRQ